MSLIEASLPFCLKEDINSSEAFTSETDVLLSLLAAWLYLLPPTASYLPASPGGVETCKVMFKLSERVECLSQAGQC